MSNSVVPALIDALVAQARANITTATVYDGFGASDDPGDYLMVGVDNPDEDEGFAESAEWTTTWAGLGARAMDEEGDVWCVAQSVNGDGIQKAARDNAFTLVNAVWALVRTEPTLGVLASPGWARPGATGRLQQNQTDVGAVARIAFQIHFQGRI